MFGSRSARVRRGPELETRRNEAAEADDADRGIDAGTPLLGPVHVLQIEQQRQFIDNQCRTGAVANCSHGPALPAEQDLLARFATIGIGPDGNFDADTLTPEMRSAIDGGMADAWVEFNTFKKDKVDTGQAGSAQFFGTAADLKGNHLYRMAGAVLGIYGNTAAEATYPTFSSDSAGAPLTGANKYAFRFAPGRLPPVNAFWSLTAYELPQSVLVANPLSRYLTNSPMLGSLVPDRDGGYSFYVQNKSPGLDKEANWLPAPQGPFALVMRLYWPKPDALNGVWTAPRPEKV